MGVKAQDILENIRKDEEERIKSTTVEKDIDVNLDLGNLLAVDSNPLDAIKLRRSKESYLMQLARGNTQLLLNNIWQLETERVEDAVVAKLPDPETRLPREKPIPKSKPPTKWEEYAKVKGIRNRKKGRMVWDDVTKSWKPRWGYQRGNDDTKEWVLEVPKNANPNEDQFEKKMKEKKERVAKNELQRLRNIARRSGKKVPGTGLTNLPNKQQSTQELEATFHQAKRSTASLGRFENNLRNEKPAKNQGKKRKFDPVIMISEKDRQMKIVNEMFKKNPKMDVNKAVNQEINQTTVRKHKPGKNGKGQKGGKKFGGKGKGKKR
uniref:Ribosome biogenesis regulatory protein n=1 Tax=Phallusia mammillata TaxID=59560 RepID=A0A6F9DRJ7_9ASCI|nr:ribosome biogenesis regulatory protein homolog [Phallusia mammillata]